MSSQGGQGQPFDTATPLRPVVPLPAKGPDWTGATWVGQVDEHNLVDGWCWLVGGRDFRRARLLIWRGEQPLGTVEVPVTDGTVDLELVRSAAAELAPLPPHRAAGVQPPISVVVCTRDRPEHLGRLLDSLRDLCYPQFEILVVDNNPASGLTPPVVEAVKSLEVRVVEVAEQGLSKARNAGLQAAQYDIVAFTDDDVVVDHRWLTNLAIGFGRDGRTACVCGMVPTSELLTPAQDYFDRRVSWAQRWHPAVYRLDEQVPDDHLFPLRISEFGTGANFAVRKDVVTSLGGFDEALGAGTATGSGEDVDVFLRILLSGDTLVREPSAVVWHSHRKTVAELESQMYGYTVGLSAWIFKLLLQPRTFAMVLVRMFTGVRHLRKVTVVEHGDVVPGEPELSGLGRRELAGVIRGPSALLRGRFAGRRATPLRASRAPIRLALTAAVLGLVGSLGALTTIVPSFVIAVVVALFVLLGPGSLMLSYYPDLPTYAKTALVPVVGAAVSILTVTGLLMGGFYSPGNVLLILTLATFAGGVLRCWQLVTGLGRLR